MLSSAINLFFVFTAIVAIFSLIDSVMLACRAARQLIQEREAAGPDWSRGEISVSFRFDRHAINKCLESNV